MKIDNKTLKKLYFDYLAQISPDTRHDCPPPELLLKSLRRSLTKRKREKVARHLMSCIHCSREFQTLLETIRKENELNLKIAGFHIIQNRTKNSFTKLIPSIANRWPRVLAYMIPIILAISISAVFILQLPHKTNHRRTRASPLKIIQPKDSHVNLSSLIFKWKELPDTDYYIIDVFDESLLPVWTSPKVRGDFVNAPPPLMLDLKKDCTYFWMVTAFQTSGSRIESLLVEFYINE
jgi:hypothetical protein